MLKRGTNVASKQCGLGDKKEIARREFNPVSQRAVRRAVVIKTLPGTDEELARAFVLEAVRHDIWAPPTPAG